jgi:hypothetical protein
MMDNFEELAMGGSLVVAVVAVMALNNVQGPDIALAPAANASDKPAIIVDGGMPVAKTITFTVTGKRLPAECKGTPASAEVEARCEALRDRTVVTVDNGANQ